MALLLVIPLLFGVIFGLDVSFRVTRWLLERIVG